MLHLACYGNTGELGEDEEGGGNGQRISVAFRCQKPDWCAMMCSCPASSSAVASGFSLCPS